MNTPALPDRLELTRNEPIGWQPALFGPATPIHEIEHRKRGAELKDFRENVVKIPAPRAAELLGVGARELYETEAWGEFSFDLDAARALLRRGAR